MISKTHEKPQPFSILMADDDDDDIMLTQDAMRLGNVEHELHVVKSGHALIAHLEGLGPNAKIPSLIFLDLNMPVMDGREVLKHLKKHDRLNCIPVIILSTSNSKTDINESYQLGASGYITKPESFDELVDIMKTINQYWYKTATLPATQ